MTFLGMVRKSALRKPLRSGLLITSVTMAFLIFALCASFIAGSQGTKSASEELMGVMNAAGRNQPLPLSYLSRITSVQGVAEVSPLLRMRGSINDPRNVVSVSAGDSQKLLAVSGVELGLTPELMRGLEGGRNRVLVGRALATVQGWHIGDRLTLSAYRIKQADGSRDWSFEVAGIFDGSTASTDTYFMLAHYDYINTARASGKDTVTNFALRPEPGIAPAALAPKIDSLFENSAAPTRSMSEKQFLSAFLSQYADVKKVMTLVVGTSFVTLLMIVINTMVFALRERRFEIGVLKTLGFRATQIQVLILGEAVFVFVVGGTLGLVLAKLASTLSPPALGLVLGMPVMLQVVGLMLVLGLIAGALPGILALRIPILSAFRAR